MVDPGGRRGLRARRLRSAGGRAVDQPFGAATLLTALNTATFADENPELSADGCELYFASARSGLSRVYVSQVTP